MSWFPVSKDFEHEVSLGCYIHIEGGPCLLHTVPHNPRSRDVCRVSPLAVSYAQMACVFDLIALHRMMLYSTRT